MLKKMVEQTNLLALNASIESNQTGEHGRTFSIVAHRIKELADEGKQNLLKIDPLMNSIQQLSSEVLGVLKESQEWIAVNHEELEEARRSLSQVQGQFNVLEQMISENEASCIKQVEIVQNMTGQLSHLLHKSRESTQLATDVQAISASQNGIVNAKRRPWFAGALQDGFYISAPYVSAITKRPCVTISTLLKDSDGAPQGILGTDIRCHVI